MFSFSFQEMLLVLVVALLVFGPKKLPELARMLGRGLAEFRRAVNEVKSTMDLDEIARFPANNHPSDKNEIPTTKEDTETGTTQTQSIESKSDTLHE